MLSPRLQMKVAQKQILTPGLVQMVTVLQLNRLELKEMINQEIVNNPVRSIPPKRSAPKNCSRSSNRNVRATRPTRDFSKRPISTLNPNRPR